MRPLSPTLAGIACGASCIARVPGRNSAVVPLRPYSFCPKYSMTAGNLLKSMHHIPLPKALKSALIVGHLHLGFFNPYHDRMQTCSIV
ncbi:MAG TPA: hypothetical protein VGN34_29955, partial [Ktedonobacteraceae bacterium]